MSDRYGSSNRRWFVRHQLEPLRETLAEAGWQVVDASRLRTARDWLCLLAATSGR